MNQAKADTGELQAAASARPYVDEVLFPAGDNNPYDLVFDISGKLERLQVKSTDRLESVNDCFRVYWIIQTRQGGQQRAYNTGEIDILALYSSTLDEVFFYRISEDDNNVPTRITVSFGADYGQAPFTDEELSPKRVL